jgi:hypothetical protein
MDTNHINGFFYITVPRGSSSAMNVVVTVFDAVRVKCLIPSGRHWHNPEMACLKESVACGRRPSI